MFVLMVMKRSLSGTNLWWVRWHHVSEDWWQLLWTSMPNLLLYTQRHSGSPWFSHVCLTEHFCWRTFVDVTVKQWADWSLELNLLVQVQMRTSSSIFFFSDIHFVALLVCSSVTWTKMAAVPPLPYWFTTLLWCDVIVMIKLVHRAVVKVQEIMLRCWQSEIALTIEPPRGVVFTPFQQR